MIRGSVGDIVTVIHSSMSDTVILIQGPMGDTVTVIHSSMSDTSDTDKGLHG